MSFFDFFDNSWKKSFNELLATNREAVDYYIKKKYKTYNDMRPDDKSLIEDYLKTYDTVFLPLTTYIEPIEKLSKEAKKYIVQRKNEVTRLYSAFSKYSSPRKRVLYLYSRFKKDDIFDKVFGDYLGENYDINRLDYEQIIYILDNYQDLLFLVSEIREKRIKKQKELRDRLRERAMERKISELINRQQNLPTEISLTKKHSEMTKRLRSLVDELISDYNSNGIFERVCRSLYTDFELTDSLPDSQYINILAHKSDMEKEKKFFELIGQESCDESAYKSFLKTKELEDNHEGVVYGLEHFVELQIYMTAQEKHLQSLLWINIQKTINDTGKTLAENFLQDFRCRTLKMFIDAIDINGELTKKVLPFNHYSQHDYTYEEETVKRTRVSYVYRNKHSAMGVKNSIFTISQNTLDNISQFVFNLTDQSNDGGAIVVLGTSGADDIVRYNNFHFWSLRNIMIKHGINCINLVDLDRCNIKKHIIVVEMVSEVERLRDTCRGLSKKFPGSTISYISIYNELTKDQLIKLIEGK